MTILPGRVVQLRKDPFHLTIVIRSEATDTEIFILGIFNFKLYTSISTRLLPAIQRQSKTLSFRPMLQYVARQWGDSSDEADAIFGGPHFVTDLSQAMRSSLAPGPQLDEQNARMGKRALVDVDALVDISNQEGKKGCRIKLFRWTRHAVTQAASCGIYGTDHPFLDRGTEESFW